MSDSGTHERIEDRRTHESFAEGFASLGAAGPFLLAVSGGPDSMALMHFAVRWARGPAAVSALHVATIDHGLRAEAAAEAAVVADAAVSLGLPHATLLWSGPKPTTRIQERAREARYALLADHACAIGATHVLTGHHADDQAETVLLRLGRGSGIGGLAGMRRLSPLAPGITLARPLLDVTKAELVAYCAAHGLATIDDPSNRDQAFARARLRRQAPALARLGLDTAGVLRLARRMARADAALEAETERAARRLGLAADAGRCRLDLAAAGDLPAEIVIRLLRRAIEAVAPNAQIRLERLETLADALWAARIANTTHRATLAGTRVVLGRDGLLEISPEAPRRRGRR